MEFKHTARHVARGSRADAERFNTLYVIKACSRLRATYQIRLQLFRAVTEGKKLVLSVKDHCKIEDDLRDLMKQYRNVIKVGRD